MQLPMNAPPANPPVLPPKALVGMIHVRALPGTPRSALPIAECCRIAAHEARTYAACGFPALMIENMHDAPYLNRRVGAEIVAAMTAVALAVREAAPTLPLGVQVLAGANEAALAVALAAGAAFIRAEGFVFAHVADEGTIESDAATLLRYRRAIGAQDIAIFTDIKKKHSSHAITADVSLAETAHAAEFFGSDGLIVTGTATGDPARPEDVAAVRAATKLPVLLGSGVTPANLHQYWRDADAFIVGSSVKRDGNWANELDPERCRALVRVAEELRHR